MVNQNHYKPSTSLNLLKRTTAGSEQYTQYSWVPISMWSVPKILKRVPTGTGFYNTRFRVSEFIESDLKPCTNKNSPRSSWSAGFWPRSSHRWQGAVAPFPFFFFFRNVLRVRSGFSEERSNGRLKSRLWR